MPLTNMITLVKLQRNYGPAPCTRKLCSQNQAIARYVAWILYPPNRALMALP